MPSVYEGRPGWSIGLVRKSPTWSRSRGTRRPGYHESDWILNLEYDQEFDTSIKWSEVVEFFLHRMCWKNSKSKVAAVTSTKKRIQGRNMELVKFKPQPLDSPMDFEVLIVKPNNGSLLLGDRRAVSSTLAAMDMEDLGLRANKKMWFAASRLPMDSAFWILVGQNEITRTETSTSRQLSGLLTPNQPRPWINW